MDTQPESRSPVLLVCGLGRCGSTLMMHALRAGGMPVVGNAPAFEPRETQPPIHPEWLRAQHGHAVKVLDPQRSPLPYKRAVSIWLDRDPAHQAASQIKLARMTGHAVADERRARRIMAAALRKDREAAMLSLRVATDLRLTLSFESILRDPRCAMRDVAFALVPWWPLDALAMAEVVRPRSPACAPDLAMEIQLMKDART